LNFTIIGINHCKYIIYDLSRRLGVYVWFKKPNRMKVKVNEHPYVHEFASLKNLYMEVYELPLLNNDYLAFSWKVG
jgi:hypothetical protein